MGIFNEQSFDHPFSRGIQGAPGVGFSLTADGNYDMNNKKLTNVGAPIANTDAATKKYVDDNSSGGSYTSSQLTVDSNIDMKNTYRITNLISPQDSKDPTTKYYVDNTFLDKDGSYPMKGNLNMGNYKIVGLVSPTNPTDAATKKYVDDNSGIDGGGGITKDIDLKNTYNIINSKTRTFNQLKANTESLVSYEEVRENFIGINEAEPMKTYMDMGDNYIYNVKTPTANDQATNKLYVDTKASSLATKQELAGYLKKDGSALMTGNLNMNDKKIVYLKPPTNPTDAATKKYVDNSIPNTSVYLRRDGSVSMTGNLNLANNKITGLRRPQYNTDAATKKYVDDNSGSIPDLSDYLEKDGSVAMTGDLNVGENLIKNVSIPHQKNDAANKEYVDKQIDRIAAHPNHYKDVFSYLMSSGSQWTDEITSRTSFNIDKIDDLPPSSGNFHTYNNKVIYMSIYGKTQDKYNFKMGINFYRLKGNTDYTLCLELLNTFRILHNITQITVDKETSTGLRIGNPIITKHTHPYTDRNGVSQSIYYHRIIINFRKLSSGNNFFFHIKFLMQNPLLPSHQPPVKFSGVYLIAYGVEGIFNSIDPDKVYDYHPAFIIKPTEVMYNVDLDVNQKNILNVKLDRNIDNSVATVAMVKQVIPHTKDYFYRQYFEEYYDFADANIYGVNINSSGVIINSLKPNITIPNKDLNNVFKEGLNVNGYDVSFSPPGFEIYFMSCFCSLKKQEFYLN